MEMDRTEEVAGRAAETPLDRRGFRVLIAFASAVGVLVGAATGVAYGRMTTSAGSIVLAGTDLVRTGRAVTLRWTLANFGRDPGRLVEVRVDGIPSPLAVPDLPGDALTEFSSPLACGRSEAPQLAITLVDGGDSRQEIGYLVDRADWATVCDR